MALVNEPTEGGGFADFHEVFLLDTETGNIWMYSHGFPLKDKDGKTIYLQSFFSVVPVDLLTGPVEQQQIQVVTSYNSAKKKASEADQPAPPELPPSVLYPKRNP